MSSARVGDVEIAYESFGEGPPLLFVMGWTASRHHWLGFHRRFADRYRVIAFDNRGVGASRGGAPTDSIRAMAEDARDLMRALDVARAHVFGVSMGGMIAQELALLAPECVDRLVLGCTHMGGPSQVPVGADVRAALGRIGTQSAEATIRELVALNFAPAFAAAHPEVLAGLVEHGLTARIPRAVFAGQSRAIATHDTAARVARIEAETLVIAGDEDRLIPAENSRLLAARLPRATLALRPSVGHMFWVESPDWAETLVRVHLR